MAFNEQLNTKEDGLKEYMKIPFKKAAGKLYRYTQIYAVIRRCSEFIIEMEFKFIFVIFR